MTSLLYRFFLPILWCYFSRILYMYMGWFSQIWTLKNMEVKKKATFYIFCYQLYLRIEFGNGFFLNSENWKTKPKKHLILTILKKTLPKQFKTWLGQNLWIFLWTLIYLPRLKVEKITAMFLLMCTDNNWRLAIYYIIKN